MTTSVETCEAVPETPAAIVAGGEQPEHFAKCGECPAAVRYRQTASGGGMFWLEKIGVDQETNFGIGDNGLPLCPFGHGEMVLADESLPAHEAITEASDRLSHAQQASLPGIIPAFNYKDVYMELEEQALRVDDAKRQYDDDKAVAAESKKAWEKAAELYTKMALEFRRRRQEKAAGPAEPEPEAEGRLLPCLFEQRNPQVPCPLCAAGTHDTPRDSEGHVDAAEKQIATNKAQALAEELEVVGQIVVFARVVAGWTDEQRAEVSAWLSQPFDDEGRLPHPRPSVLGTSHVAAAVEDGAGVQFCRECGGGLVDLDNGDTAPYAIGTLVGIDCPGAGQSYPKRGGKKKKARG